MFTIGITGPTGAGKTTALWVLKELGGQVIDCDAVYHELLQTDGALLGRIEAAFPGVVRDWTLDRKALGARVYADPTALKRLTDLTWPAVCREVGRRLKDAEALRSCHSERSEESVPPSPVARRLCRPKAWLVAPGLAVRDAQREPTGLSALSALVPVASSDASATSGRHPSTGLEAGPPPLQAGEVSAAPTGFAVIDAIGLFESGLAELCDLTAAVVADEEVRVRRLMERDGVTEDYARARIAAQKPAAWFAERADLVLENNGTEAEFTEKCREEFTCRLPALQLRSGR